MASLDLFMNIRGHDVWEPIQKYIILLLHLFSVVFFLMPPLNSLHVYRVWLNDVCKSFA